jgi:hypothetical protein
MGVKKEFVHVRMQLISQLYVLILMNQVFYFCGFVISYVCIIYRMSWSIFILYKYIILHDHDQSL